MTTETILCCFAIVAGVFFIQWIIIGWCIYEINQRFDEEKKVQEIRRIYQNNERSDIECTLDIICDKVNDIHNFIENYEHKTFEGD